MSKSLSKFISLILRHRPEVIEIQVDEHGWADVEELINGINKTGRTINMELLEDIVLKDEKQRYSFNEDKRLIRANQGHSIPVDVELKEQIPPEILYHGTAERFLESIMHDGIRSMSRLYVHLSKDERTAHMVGKRHGKPVILKVESGKMYHDGIKFYLSANGVWLTKFVDRQYIDRLDSII